MDSLANAYEHLTIARHDSVVELVLDRAEAHNALSTAMARELASACGELTGDSTVRVVVLTSASAKAFCVGADLMRQRPVFRAAFGGVLDLPVPTVAAVHGFALGGGYELALCCDLVVLSLIHI